MSIQAIIIIGGILGLLLFIAGFRRLRRGQLVTGTIEGLSALVLLLAAGLLVLFASNLYTYHRLTHEQEVAEIQFTHVNPQFYRVAVSYPSGVKQTFDLYGDDWQIDAKILKWKGLATVLGFDTVYRLQRLSGRYQNIEQERSQKRVVHDLSGQQNIDLWDTVKRYNDYLPWVDTHYGSATFLPMADGALYSVTVSNTGLVARPLNLAARNAVKEWR